MSENDPCRAFHVVCQLPESRYSRPVLGLRLLHDFNLIAREIAFRLSCFAYGLAPPKNLALRPPAAGT